MNHYISQKNYLIYGFPFSGMHCIQYWRWESFPCLTVSHKFPRDTLCPVVIRSISEHFCDYHGTWLSPRYNHRNFQTWVITTELSGHDVSCGNLWDTVRHGKLSHRQYCIWPMHALVCSEQSKLNGYCATSHTLPGISVNHRRYTNFFYFLTCRGSWKMLLGVSLPAGNLCLF